MELQTITIEESEKDFNYLFDLKEQWRKSSRRLTDKELLEAFPEAKQIIPEQIKEWDEKREKIVETIKKKLTIIGHTSTPENQWFWREVIKVWEGQELLEIDGHITLLKRLLWIAKGRVLNGRLTEEQIQQALSMPIENIIYQQSIQLRKSGKALVGLCPFHQEKTPSFFIYPESNSFYCYGCNQGGNVINFVRLLHGYSFKETVKYLIGQ